MKALKIISIIIIALVILFGIIYAYYGGFKTIVFKEEVQGGETFVYEEMIGDYSQTPKMLDKIYQSLLQDEKIETTKGIGIFYDDPKVVEKSQLRSEIGCIVEDLDSAEIAKLSEKYKVKTLEKSECIVVEFPYKGMPSIIVGIMRVYPAFGKYVEQHGVSDKPFVEIYDMPGEKTVYRIEKN